MPPSSATMRGIAGETMVWLMEATSMPSMSPMKTRRPEASRWKGSAAPVAAGEGADEARVDDGVDTSEVRVVTSP